MGRRSRKAQWYAAVREPVDAREALERRWWPRVQRDPRLATMVTAEGARHEPYHRWYRYRQGFSPLLVRQFLKETMETGRAHDGGYEEAPGAASCGQQAVLPVLDPFAGSGTCPLECTRRGVPAIGVEALEPLVFLASAWTARKIPPLPELPASDDWALFADLLSDPVHRAALMLAVARRHTTSGKPNRGAAPLAVELATVLEMMRDDLCQSLRTIPNMMVGDARRLEAIADDSIGAVLTSPPYLSRHDYTRITDPLEQVYRHWYAVEKGMSAPEATQLSAHPRSITRRPKSFEDGDPVEEAALWLEHLEQKKLAGVVRSYFNDMDEVLNELYRVAAPGAVCWLLVGGARLKDVYVPSDMIVAGRAELRGFAVPVIRAARDLVHGARKFGSIARLAPRESVVVMVKPG